MDSDRIHTIHIGLKTTIGFCPNEWFARMTHEILGQEADAYENLIVNRQYVVRVGSRVLTHALAP